MSYVIISKWESFNKKNLKVGPSGRWGGRTPGVGSAGEEREVTGVHDETGVQVQTLWGDKTDQRGETYWLTLTSSVRMKSESFFFLFTAIMLYIFTEIYQNQQEQLNACMMQKRRTDLGQSWASCWTRRPPDLRCPQGRCWRLNHSTHWESRLQQEGCESIWINPNLLSGLLSHLLSSVSWWAWTERGCSACPWTQPPGRWAQRSSQVRWKLVQAAWLRLSSSQFFWVTRRKLGLCCPHTTSSSLCS